MLNRFLFTHFFCLVKVFQVTFSCSYTLITPLEALFVKFSVAFSYIFSTSSSSHSHINYYLLRMTPTTIKYLYFHSFSPIAFLGSSNVCFDPNLAFVHIGVSTFIAVSCFSHTRPFMFHTMLHLLDYLSCFHVLPMLQDQFNQTHLVFGSIFLLY